MNPPLSYSDAKTQLQLLTSQTTNFTFTDDEITQALNSAWNDPFVARVVWDSSTTFTPGTWQYPLPDTVNTVRGLYFKRTTSDYPEPISPDLYEVVAGNIQVLRGFEKWIYDNYTIYIKGLYKLTTDDDLDSDNLVNYVISNAAYLLLRTLAYKRTFVFLRTDTTMRDITDARNMMFADMIRWKQSLQREFESA